LVFWGASAGLFSAIIASAYSIKLGWNTNSEADLEGYMLYGRQGSPCPPYDQIDTYREKNLADPLNPMVRITDLDKDLTYYFIVTAYDTFGNESDFSDVVSVFNGEGGNATCSSGKGSSRGGDGGGGSGGGGGGGG